MVRFPLFGRLQFLIFFNSRVGSCVFSITYSSSTISFSYKIVTHGLLRDDLANNLHMIVGSFSFTTGLSNYQFCISSFNENLNK